jgi:hypothetical protein
VTETLIGATGLEPPPPHPVIRARAMVVVAAEPQQRWKPFRKKTQEYISPDSSLYVHGAYQFTRQFFVPSALIAL